MNVIELIARALRKIGVVAAGEDPTAYDANAGLEALRAMYMEMIGSGVFGRVRDVAIAANASDFTAYENARYTFEDKGATVMTLPDFVSGWWIYDYGWRRWCHCDNKSGNVRPVRDGSIVIANDLASDYELTVIYDAQEARWIDLYNIDMMDPAPMSKRFSEGLACELAIRLADEYQQVAGAATVRGAAAFKSALFMRADGPRRPSAGVFI